MYKKIIVISLLLFIFPLVALADCSEYTSDCESHEGCTIGKNGNCIYNNLSETEFKSCGNGLIDNIPPTIPKVTSIIYSVIQVIVPVLLVILGSIDLVKAVIAGKEDEIKKNQSILIKRLIIAILVFFVFVIVKFFISLVADNDEDNKNNATNIIDCAECFIGNNCG